MQTALVNIGEAAAAICVRRDAAHYESLRFARRGGTYGQWRLYRNRPMCTHAFALHQLSRPWLRDGFMIAELGLAAKTG
jgi:hypothetical protein